MSAPLFYYGGADVPPELNINQINKRVDFTNVHQISRSPDPAIGRLSGRVRWTRQIMSRLGVSFGVKK